MGRHIHLEGMGVVGSLLGYQLQRAGVEWSWHDTDARYTAWHASTGCVYPVGEKDGKSASGYRWWQQWLKGKVYPHGTTEVGEYWFNQKAPPHEGRYTVTKDIKAIRSGAASFHINAQKLVPTARKQFSDRRTEKPPRKGIYIVAHGFSKLCVRYLWGWSRLVDLQFSSELQQQLDSRLRPCFYFRQGRFRMAYAYPCPGTPYWYAGSSLINQKVAKELTTEPKYQAWEKLLFNLSGEHVWGSDVKSPLVQGWRPVRYKIEQEKLGRYQELEVVREGSTIITPPLWHSGIRHFPLVWEQLIRELKL